jgi:hypothetical protein
MIITASLTTLSVIAAILVPLIVSVLIICNLNYHDRPVGFHCGIVVGLGGSHE